MFGRSFIAAACLVALLAAAGCHNGFKEFYQGDRFEAIDEARTVGSQPAGTRPIGRSSFISADAEGDSEAVSAAKSVGADYVVWSSEYQGTTQSSGAIPFTSPTTTTTTYQESNSGSVYGPRGGYAGSYSGNTTGSATTYGSTTTYVPYTVVHHWMKYTASFYRSLGLDTAPPKK